MTDSSGSAADWAASTSTPDDETSVADVVPVPNTDEAELDATIGELVATRARPAVAATPGATPDQATPPPLAGPSVATDAPAVATSEAPAKSRPRRRSLALRFGVAFVLGLLLTGGLGVGALYAWDQQYVGRVLPSVRVGTMELGGLTRAEAEAEIASADASLAAGQITLTGPDGQTTTIKYADIGRGLDTSGLVDAALAAGRETEPLGKLIDEPRAALRGVTLDAPVTYDRDKLAAAIAALATTIDQAPVDATVSLGQDGIFGVSPGKPGRAVDKAALVAALDQQLLTVGTPAISMAVPVVSLAPTVTNDASVAASGAANRMAADMEIVRGMDTWGIARASLAPLISFSTATDGTLTPVLDESGLDPILSTLAKQVDQTVQEAGLKLVKDHVVAVDTGREGRTLDVAATKEAVVREIAARRAGEGASLVAATVATVEPVLSTAAAEAFAPNMRMLSSYSVYYYPIINNHWGGNIEAPATKIDGTVVPAGTVFDFWQVVGDLRLLPGEGPGNAIEGGKITVTGAFGGGICTTSTTLFNAAFRAGMVPIARQNHNEFISRYPPGLDATVWIVGNTKQTMSFKNDTEFPILITHTITKSAGGKRWLTFNIWSVPNGRTAKISDLVIQPGPKAIDTTEEDSTKPVGYTFRNNSPVDGAKVWVTVTIYDHGKVHWTKRYYSNYPAVNGVLVVGTKPA